MSELQIVADRLRDRLVDRYGLTEVGDPYEPLVLAETGERVGEVRVWTGASIPKLVDSRLVVPERGMDSTMLHAFTPSDAAVPHLTSDVAGFQGRLAFAVDLTPRVELAMEPAYMDVVYPPLSDVRTGAYAIDGAEPMELPPRLLAFTSPWITGVNVGADRLEEVERAYTDYMDRFVALLDGGVPDVADGDLVARDRRHRHAQFDPASDAVWDFLAGMLGRSSVDTLLDLVREPGPPPPR